MQPQVEVLARQLSMVADRVHEQRGEPGANDELPVTGAILPAVAGVPRGQVAARPLHVHVARKVPLRHIRVEERAKAHDQVAGVEVEALVRGAPDPSAELDEYLVATAPELLRRGD